MQSSRARKRQKRELELQRKSFSYKQRKEALIPENIEAPNSPEHVAAASDAVEDEPMEVASPEPRAPPPALFTLGDLVKIHPESAPGVRSYFANAFIGTVCRMEYLFQEDVYIVAT